MQLRAPEGQLVGFTVTCTVEPRGVNTRCGKTSAPLLSFPCSAVRQLLEPSQDGRSLVACLLTILRRLEVVASHASVGHSTRMEKRYCGVTPVKLGSHAP